MTRHFIVTLAAVLLAGTTLPTAQRPVGPPPFDQGPGGRGPGPQPEAKIVARFDKDGDGRLNAAERTAAFEYVTTQGGGRMGRMGGGPRGGGTVTGRPGRPLSPTDVTSFGRTPLYDMQTLRTIFLTFEDANWEAQLMAFKPTDVEVPATMVVDGTTFRDVGIRFRGASSFMGVPEGLKHSINLSVDYAHADQRLLGYRTLNLLNSHTDPTFLRAVLFYEAARDYLPAPKANYLRLAINGESWGVYVNVQQFNKDSVSEGYGTPDGARWKVPGSPGGRGGLEYLGEDPAAYTRTYEIKSKDDAKSWAALVALCRTLNQTPPERLEAALAPMLDIDETLKFLALDNALANADGYWVRASDYSIYQDPRGRFHILPHDANETFGAGRGGGPGGPGGRPGGPGRMGRGGPPDPIGGGFPPPPGGARGPMFAMSGGAELDPLVGLDDPTRPLRSKLFAVPALRARYLTYVKAIATKWLDWDTLGPRATRYQALIAEEVQLDTRKLDSFEAFQAGVDGLKTFVARRRAFLLR
jgi:hypothetical protein